MAGFELPIIVGIIGTAFFLVYASSKVDGNGGFLQVFKIFLFLSGFAIILFIPPLGKYFIDANNGSAATGLVNSTWNPLYDLVGSQITIYYGIFLFLIGLYTCYLVWLVYMQFLRKN